jgi:predicted nucleic acid-binding protein
VADVVSNTSPISYLHRLDRLTLLRDLFGTVLVPDAVEQELSRGRALGFDLPDPRLVPWMQVRAAPAANFENLGAGEAAALSLAVNLPGALVLLDDLPARKRAAALSLNFTGTVGLLIKAKSDGLLTLIRPELERLQVLGFRMSPAIEAAALVACGEG